MVTIIDEEVKEYLWATIDHEGFNDEDIDVLLDKVRAKLKVDIVFLKEWNISHSAFAYTHISSEVEGKELLGREIIISDEQLLEFQREFSDNTVVVRHSVDICDMKAESSMYYGVMSEDSIQGIIGVVDVKNKHHIWHKEERQALLWLGKTLEQVVNAHYTHRLMEEQKKQKKLLEEALHQAEQANVAKRLFLSNMSHDIRTPMNAILGFAALAATHIQECERVQDYLAKIMSSSKHLLSLINNVLDMNRIETGNINLEEAPCSLAEIMHEVKNILIGSINAKQQDFFIDTVDVKHEHIICDRTRLNQILLNLLGNAIKYTQSGGTISVRIIELHGAPAGWAKFEFHVKDNGMGMSSDFVKKVFEPFERELNSGANAVIGTGLGMAITKNIVDLMNGDIEVQSEKGVGTEFVVTLSFQISDEVPEKIEIEELKGVRTLVVDDDFNTCRSVTNMLENLGMRSEWTMYGKEAILRTQLAHERGDDYHVYIVDWLIPDINGIEVARRIRQEIGDMVPIIVLTAYDWSEIEEEAKEAGVSGFISKPLFMSELSECLKRVCTKGDDSSDDYDESSPLVEEFMGRRILLVEDNEMNQEIAIAILEEAGFFVELACDGKESVDKVINNPVGHYDIVLMDIQMPIMNGYEAAREIRNLADPDLANIPIIAMTADAFEEDRMAALEAGMNEHISKPIDVEVLFHVLKYILKG